MTEEDRSVQSGLTLEDLKGGRLPEPVPEAAAESPDRGSDKKDPFPTRLKPMLANTAEAAFSHPDWLFEPKLDGYRVLAFVREGEATLLSRNGLDLTSRLPMVAGELQAQPEEDFVLDGEVVALDESGLPDFGLLQQSMGMERGAVGPPPTAVTLVYYPFDTLYLGGRDLRRVPLGERKRLLARMLIPAHHVRPVEYVDGEGEAFFQATGKLGLEGMVAKRRNSTYEPGTRSSSWLKVKAVQDQEFVVGGYTPGMGERSETFGALLVGYYEGKVLRYAGKVGSGFDKSTLVELNQVLTGLHRTRSPFAPDPELEKSDGRWVRPKLVARVKFAQWTADGRLRAPVFMGLRPEVDAKGVVRETSDAVSSLLAGC